MILAEFSSSGALLLTFSLVVSCLAYAVVYDAFFHPLAHIPGPFLSKVSTVPSLLRFFSGKGHRYEALLFRKYGPLVRVSPNVLMFNDPTWLPLVYHRKADKGPSYDITEMLGVVGTKGHVEHAFARKRLAGPLSNSAILKMKPLVQGHVDRWLAALGEFAGRRELFDISPWAHFLIYDILSDLCFGAPLGFIEQRRDVERLVSSSRDSMVYLGVAARKPELVGWLKKARLRGLMVPQEKDRSGIAVLMRFRNQMLEERLRNPSDQLDILNHLIHAKSKFGAEVDIPTIKNEMVTLMIAGTNTSAVTIHDIILNLARNHSAVTQLRETLAQDDESYLNACVKESVRAYPPFALPLPRLAPSEGLSLGDHHVPAGYEVAASPWILNRDRETFGVDADEWKPERWLVSQIEVQRMEQGLFSWGYGARMCLGRPLAELEVSLAIKGLFERFEVELDEKCDEMPGEAIYDPLRRLRPIRVRLRRRESDPVTA